MDASFIADVGCDGLYFFHNSGGVSHRAWNREQHRLGYLPIHSSPAVRIGLLSDAFGCSHSMDRIYAEQLSSVLAD